MKTQQLSANRKTKRSAGSVAGGACPVGHSSPGRRARPSLWLGQNVVAGKAGGSGARLSDCSVTALLAFTLLVLFPALPLRSATPTGYSADIHFDLAKVPFSRFGSYLAFSHLAATAEHPEGLYLRTLHGFVSQRELFRVELMQSGKSVPFSEVGSPTLLRLEADGGSAEIAFGESHLIRVRGRGVELRLSGLIL